MRNEWELFDDYDLHDEPFGFYTLWSIAWKILFNRQ